MPTCNIQNRDQDLEVIEYETYKLIIGDIPKFYIVTISEGLVSANFRSRLDDRLNVLVTKFLDEHKNKAAEDLLDLKTIYYIRENLNSLFPPLTSG
ncbi:MAG: hypothetical protein HKN39_06370 [Flavobacteriales bacterium]|nr:hypothetical protein [Flavobacteriales bacterium]